MAVKKKAKLTAVKYDYDPASGDVIACECGLTLLVVRSSSDECCPVLNCCGSPMVVVNSKE